jgi:hypothetical protein
LQHAFQHERILRSEKDPICRKHRIAHVLPHNLWFQELVHLGLQVQQHVAVCHYFPDLFPDRHLRVTAFNMELRTIKEMREELDYLMHEEIESLRKQTYGGISPEELREQDERLKRIREVSADYLAALKRNIPSP